MLKKLFLSLVCLSMVFTNLTFVNAKDSSKYDIYPIVRDIEYHSEDDFVLEDVNVVFESDIDEATRNYLKEVLNDFDIHYVETDPSVFNPTIYLGINGSNGYADALENNMNIKTNNLYDYYDAYVLDVKDNNVVIVGKDSDAVFRGIATLKMMLSSVDNNALLGAHIEDYSTLEYRGFIEGFYGGWDYPTRKELMKFAKDIKMNSYIYASKTDAYHTNKWHTLYPESDIKEIAELVKVGQETKCYYAWSVHISGFFSGLNTADSAAYETRYNQLIAKFDQLYNVGVRKFDILNDDFGAGTNEDVVKLLNRLTKEYIEPKGCEPIVYCPQGYNTAWSGNGAELDALKALDESIILYWTGADVNSPIEQSSIDYATNRSGHDVCFWLNYPVNEHAHQGIFLGDITHYARDNVKLRAAVSNPSRFGYANKVGLFQLAALFWNNSNYSQYANEIYKNSFNYLEEGVEDAYRSIAEHISNCPSSSRVPQGFPESEMIKPYLTDILNKVNAGTSIKDDENKDILMNEFDKVLNAIEVFKTDCKNTQLINELNPWLNSLKSIMTSAKSSLQAVIALENHNVADAWTYFSAASKNLAAYDDNPTYTNSDKMALAGSKRIQPFASSLVSYVNNQLRPIFDSSYTDFTPTLYAMLGGSVKSHDNNANKLFDNDLSTSVQWNTVQKVNDYYGVDLGRVMKVTDIEITQGNTDSDHDIFHTSILEYSKDGISFEPISAYTNDYHIALDDLDIEARFVRLRLTETGYGSKPDFWTHAREFTVNKKLPTGDRVYTNVEEYKETPLTLSDDQYMIADIKDLTLKPNEYIGIKFIDLTKVIAFIKDITNGDQLTAQYSVNGTDWEAFKKADASTIVKYVRLINATNQTITSSLNSFGLSATSLTPNPSFLETNLTNGIKEGQWEHVFDNDDSTYVWTNEGQSINDYMTFDLGRMIKLYDLEIVTTDGNPRFYNAEIQISTDNETWTKIAEVKDDNSVFVVPYRYVNANAQGAEARYLRILITGDSGYYLKIHEIKMNKTVDSGVHVITSTFDADMNQVIDGNLSTLVSTHVNVYDEIEYTFTEGTSLNAISFLQDPQSISNAKVELYGDNGYEVVGTLNESAKMFELDHSKHYTKMRISFDKPTQFNLYEIYVDYDHSSKDDIGLYVDPIIKTPEVTSGNIILNKLLEVSGTSNGNKTSINDGDISTKWDSDYIKGNNAKEEAWIIADLGEGSSYIFNSMTMNYFNKVYPTATRIEISSDKNTWFTIKELTSEHNGPIHPIVTTSFDDSYSARYIRIVFEELNNVAAGNGVGVNEWSVDGKFISNAQIDYVMYTKSVTIEKNGSVELPEFVYGSLNDYLIAIPVVYDQNGFDASKPGTYTIKGTLQLPFATDQNADIIVVVKGEEANKAELQAKYDEVNGTEKGNYTDESYQAFTNALAAAKLVLANEEAIQEEVDTALANLKAAYAGLKEIEKPVEKPFPFEDVFKGQWYYEYVDQAYQLGLMTGATETLFKPTVSMNRGMVAIVLHRMEGAEEVAYAPIFPDVYDKQYFTTAVMWAKQTGIITGYNNGTFMPLKNVTREEMATMIQRFAKYKGLDVTSSKDITYFKDYAEISTYAKAPIQWCVENGVLSGKFEGTKVDPLGTATRAECAKMLVQAYKVIYK